MVYSPSEASAEILTPLVREIALVVAILLVGDCFITVSSPDSTISFSVVNRFALVILFSLHQSLNTALI